MWHSPWGFVCNKRYGLLVLFGSSFQEYLSISHKDKDSLFTK